MKTVTREVDIERYAVLDTLTEEQREMIINELKHICVEVRAPREITDYFDLFPMAIRLGDDYFLSLADQIKRKLDCFERRNGNELL